MLKKQGGVVGNSNSYLVGQYITVNVGEYRGCQGYVNEVVDNTVAVFITNAPLKLTERVLNTEIIINKYHFSISYQRRQNVHNDYVPKTPASTATTASYLAYIAKPKLRKVSSLCYEQ